MTDIYKINSTDIPISSAKEVLTVLNMASKKLNVQFYVIGALARDIMTILLGGKPYKATRDIDIAVMVSEDTQYYNLIEYLLKYKQFRDDKELPYRLYIGKNMVDILPFGEIESDERDVTIDLKKTTKLSTIGLREVFKFSVRVLLDEEQEINIASLAGLCILKLIAYSEKPAERIKDIKDVNFIIENFDSMFFNNITENHFDLLSDGWDKKLFARVLGRDMSIILNEFKVVKDKILEILDSNIKENYDSKIVQLMTGSNGTLEEKVEVLKSLRQGILDDFYG